MAEVQPDEPIDIADRPYLHGLAESNRTERSVASGSAHLLAAATGVPTSPVTANVHGVPISLTPATAGINEETRAQSDGFTARPAHDAQAIHPKPTSPIVQQWSAEQTVDYDLVVRHVRELDLEEQTIGRTREVFDVASASERPETPEEEAAWAQIQELVKRHVTQLVLQQGESHDWSETRRAAHVQAVFDEAFRYGPLSALLREDVEDIDVRGYDSVTVKFPDGHREERPPITSSDEQLEEYIAKIATDRGRQFARPHGTIKLDLGGARFTAIGGPQIRPRPRIAIRKHRLVDIDLESLVELGTLTTRMATFLTASMRAFASHLIAGFPGTGKTTFMRALASALSLLEPIVTIETERELYLHKLPERHRLVDALQFLPDVNSGDDRTAAFSLDNGIEYALRMNAQVILFGEVISPSEAASAIKALQAGKGASSTIHAGTAYEAIQRLSTALVQAGGFSDDVVPQRQIMQALDLIVQLDTVPGPNGSQRRVVSELSEVVPGDAAGGRDQRPIVKPIYRWNEDGGFFEFVEEPSPLLRRRMHRAGLPEHFFEEHRA